MDNKLIIYKSSRKAVVIVLSGILFALAGWFFLTFTHSDTVGWSFIILSLFCVVFGIGSFYDRKPYIILTERGLTEMTGIREEIEWSAILQVDEFYYRGQFFIRLLTDRNYKPDLVRPTWFYRLDRIYKQEGLKAIFIRIGYLEVDATQLSQFIDKMIKASDAVDRKLILNKFRSTIQVK